MNIVYGMAGFWGKEFEAGEVGSDDVLLLD
jgi:hypothetical protein